MERKQTQQFQTIRDPGGQHLDSQSPVKEFDAASRLKQSCSGPHGVEDSKNLTGSNPVKAGWHWWGQNVTSGLAILAFTFSI